MLYYNGRYMKKIGLISVLVVLAGLAWYVIAGAQTAGNNATNTAVNDDSQQELIVVTPWELTSTDPSKSGFIFQRLQIAETLVDAKQNAELQPMLAHGQTRFGDVANKAFFLIQLQINNSKNSQNFIVSKHILATIGSFKKLFMMYF